MRLILLKIRILSPVILMIQLVFLPLLHAACQSSANADWTRTHTALVPAVNSDLIPLNELGENTYKEKQGGLYPNGNNFMPAAHRQAGIALAASIKPLDVNGNNDPDGKYVLISVGFSNTSSEFIEFLDAFANNDPDKDPHLVVVNGAQPKNSAEMIANPNNPNYEPYWSKIDQRLFSYGLTPAQVAVVWMKEVDANPNGEFPDQAEKLQSNLEEITRIIKSRFLNVKLVYNSSRIYAGYTLDHESPEPYSYEGGFAIKWMIENQINNTGNLNFDSTKGPVVAPWLAWGPYIWANGLGVDGVINGVPGNSGVDLPYAVTGFDYGCEDFESDGRHPSKSSGEKKVAQLLWDFFRTDLTAQQWYLANPPPIPAKPTRK